MAATEQARVAVVGGFNVDLVFSAPRRPEAGETLVGSAFGTFVGGKGANQAVAAARAGARVEMIGRLGADGFGRDIRSVLEHEGIALRHIVEDAESGTGVAGIVVEADGSNSIVVVPRANGRLSARDVRRGRAAIGGAAVLLLQLEVPVEASIEAARIAADAGVMVVLNPAPAADLPAALLEHVDVLVPNETEARQLTGLPVATEDEARLAARALVQRGVATVVVTLGERGALLATTGDGRGDGDGATGGGEFVVPAIPVRAVDTTAAGDAFCGALAVALAEGQSTREAVRFACAAGALAVTVMGAGPSLPSRNEVERLLRHV